MNFSLLTVFVSVLLMNPIVDAVMFNFTYRLRFNRIEVLIIYYTSFPNVPLLHSADGTSMLSEAEAQFMPIKIICEKVIFNGAQYEHNVYLPFLANYMTSAENGDDIGFSIAIGQIFRLILAIIFSR